MNNIQNSTNELSVETEVNDNEDVIYGNPIEYIEDSQKNYDFILLKTMLNLNIYNNISSRNIIPSRKKSNKKNNEDDNIYSYDLFCNRELNMECIKTIGFDMDYTLALYTKEFDLLAYNGAKEKLVTWLKYPKIVLDLIYEQNMCRRGNIIDKKRGNLLKLDRYKYVRVAEHGLTPLEDALRKSIYKEAFSEIENFVGSNFVIIDTPFTVVDASLFAQLVDLKDRFSTLSSIAKAQQTLENNNNNDNNNDNSLIYQYIQFFSSKSYLELWNDLRKCVDRCHKDGVIKLKVAENPSKYIIFDPNIFPMLQEFKNANKKLFLLTNSLYDYTHVVMNYLYNKSEGNSKTFEWMDYFDIIICGGNKPAFLIDEKSSLSLYKINIEDGSLLNIDTLPTNSKETIEFLNHHGKVFQGGNAKKLVRLLQTPMKHDNNNNNNNNEEESYEINCDNILYVGDHVYSDILRSKRSLGWRTCLIVPELAKEIIFHKQFQPQREELMNLRKKQYLVEEQLDTLVTNTGGNMSNTTKTMINQLQDELATLKTIIKSKLYDYDRSFHPRWGQLFKAGFQESQFAKQIRDYSCIYTSRASNLGLVSPSRPFRPVRDKMPHDHFLEGF
eukprot:gene12807-17168_t